MLLKMLEEVSHDHAKILRSLGKSLARLRSDPSNDEIQLLVLSYVRRLRAIRTRLSNILSSNIAIRIEDNDYLNIASDLETLAEYFILVGLELEKDLLRIAKYMSKRGALLIKDETNEIEKDLQQVDELKRSLQSLINMGDAKGKQP